MTDYKTARAFLRALGHPVAIIGHKPRRCHLPRTSVVWPVDIDSVDDAADIACGMSDDYESVYCNLNPLKLEMLTVRPPDGRSVRDTMIAARTRVLIDVDAHGIDKQIAEEQKNAIKQQLGHPLIETDSGNGFALIYTCDPKHRRIDRFLSDLQQLYPCVDASVGTLSRLTRIIGTTNTSKADGFRIPTRLLSCLTFPKNLTNMATTTTTS